MENYPPPGENNEGTPGASNEASDDAPAFDGISLDEFYGQSILMALARIYDVLLIQVAQSDDELAKAIQVQHYQGGYLFPTIFPPETPPPSENEDPRPSDEGSDDDSD